MTRVSTEQAQHDLPKLLERVRHGEVIVIEQDGKDVGRLSPISEGEAKRPVGFLRGRFVVPEDFNEMMRDEIEEMFYGSRDLSS